MNTRLHLLCAALLLGTFAAVAGADPGGQAAPPAPAAPSLGTLEYGPTLYYPQGCSHNGSTVVCTFVFVHQAETATIRAGGGGSQLTGIQFVDDGHVPHLPNNAYFVDRYGMRQHLLTVNRADQGTMMVEFPLVDPRVSAGELHLGTQVLGGIPVGQGGAQGSPGAPNALAAGNGQQAQAPGGIRQAAAPQSNCNTPQMAKTAGCRLQTKTTGAQGDAANAAQQVGAVTDAAKQIGTLLGSFGKKPAAGQATPPSSGNQ